MRTAFPRPGPTVGLLPLLDVVFLLLLVFVYAMARMRPTAGIELDLARVATSTAEEAPRPLRIAIDRAGDIFLDGRHFERASLAAHLATLGAADRERGISVEADAAATHGSVLGVLDTIASVLPGKVTLVGERR